MTSLKRVLFGNLAKVRRIPLGLYRGLRMRLDLQSKCQFFVGLHEVETHAWIRRYGSVAQAVVDVGAGEGELVLYALKRTNAKRVYAFEPNDSERNRLDENLALNGFENDSRSFVCKQFVGASDDSVFCSLDSLLPTLEAPALVKVDVDGAEMDVLGGSSRLIESRIATWLVETHSFDLEAECLKLFHSAGYKTQVIPNGWYRKVLPETRPIAHNRWLIAEPPRGTA